MGTYKPITGVGPCAIETNCAKRNIHWVSNNALPSTMVMYDAIIVTRSLTRDADSVKPPTRRALVSAFIVRRRRRRRRVNKNVNFFFFLRSRRIRLAVGRGREKKDSDAFIYTRNSSFDL